MAGAALAYAGASAGLDVLSGLFDYLASQEVAAAAESRGRMLRMEADAEAERYGEQARDFKAQQALRFLKSGVTLSGSPLDVLDETARVASENISAIRARGSADQLEMDNQAAIARGSGRSALLKGITGGFGKLAWASYKDKKTTDLGGQNRKNIYTVEP